MPAPTRSRRRIARFFLRASIPILLAAQAASPARAEPAPPPAAPEPPPPAAPASADSIRVYLEKGRVLDVAYVEYASIGYIRLVGSDGAERLLPEYRVVSIESAAGRDLTARILEKRGSSGERPAALAAARRRPGFRLHASRLPECTSYAVTELGYLIPVGTVDATRGDRGSSAVLDYGWMKNHAPSHALGAVLHLDANDYRLRFGPAFRYRRWISSRIALDSEAGILFLGRDDDRDFDFDGPALLGQVDLQAAGIVAVTAQVETRAVRYTGPSYLASGRADQRGADLRLGAKLGGTGGVAATIGLLSAAALVSMLIASAGPW